MDAPVVLPIFGGCAPLVVAAVSLLGVLFGALVEKMAWWIAALVAKLAHVINLCEQSDRPSHYRG